jgi:RNA polymerase sigma factor (sigma-70 family)
MQELDDNALLREYAERGSGAAFAALVERHVNQVYSAALRRTGQPHLAEEITQAVFVTLAQKSRSLDRRVVLSGWLYQTAQWTALTYLRGEIRRARREEEAHMQTVANEPEAEVWRQIAPVLDDALAALNETDRHAIVLRFFDGKSMREVGAALGANESAAKMRVGRALEKLRNFFSKRGIASTAETLAGALSTHAIQPAPVALAKTITAFALAKGAAASLPTAALAKSTFIALTMKAKTIVATAVISTLILGGGAGAAYYLWHQKLPRVTFASKLPLAFANSVFKPDGDRDGFFTVDWDTNMLRTSTSAPAIHIKGPIGTMANGSLVNPNGSFGNSDNSASTVCVIGPGSPLLGKHVCVTGWLKASNVQHWASAFVLIPTQEVKSKGWSRVDSMSDRPIFGTTDWLPVKFVTDLPAEPCAIYFGPDLYGPGELWGDDFQISLADPDDPITDDRAWCQTFDSGHDYSMTTDPANPHDGSPSLCLAYAGPDNASGKSWTWLGHHLRYPENEQYVGHTVRLSGWIKTKNASGHLQPQIRPSSGSIQNNSKLLAKDSMVNDHSLRGTLDWTPLDDTCVIPKNTGSIAISFIFWGGGKVWIDTNSLELTIVK